MNNIFKHYIDFIFNIKTNLKNNIEKFISKSLLNSLLDRFGIIIDKHITKWISNKKFELLSPKNKIILYKSMGINKTLLSYMDKLNPDIIECYNHEKVKLANKYNKHKYSIFDTISLPICTTITIFNRIHTLKIKLSIENIDDKVYYSDIDSIVTHIKLFKHIISFNI